MPCTDSRPSPSPVCTLPRLFCGLPAMILLATLLLAIAVPGIAGEVYQWKDAKGVSHYADAPPPNQAHKSRAINRQGSAVIAAAAKPVAINADCSNARANLNILQGKGEVGIDDNKDGKADRNLTATERANRTQLAEAGVKTYCDVALASEPGLR